MDNNMTGGAVIPGRLTETSDPGGGKPMPINKPPTSPNRLTPNSSPVYQLPSSLSSNSSSSSSSCYPPTDVMPPTSFVHHSHFTSSSLNGLHEESCYEECVESFDKFQHPCYQGNQLKTESHPLKLLSISTPAMSPSRSPIARSETDADVHGSSKYRQKKFQRHFKPNVDGEKVIDDFFCALVGEILLHGHLYITEKYFGFYSNVFGYITKILIPVTSVTKITKEKTAKIFPNAVGVYTSKSKHIFGSLISRDNTFKVMQNVLLQAGKIDVGLHDDSDSEDLQVTEDDLEEDGEVDVASSNSSLRSRSSKVHREEGLLCPEAILAPSGSLCTEELTESYIEQIRIPPHALRRKSHGSNRSRSGVTFLTPKSYLKLLHEVDRTTRFLLCTTLFLMSLLCLAYLVQYRASPPSDPLRELSNSEHPDAYGDYFISRSQLHSSSSYQLYHALHSQVENLVQVRKSLETLTMMFHPDRPDSDR